VVGAVSLTRFARKRERGIFWVGATIFDFWQIFSRSAIIRVTNIVRLKTCSKLALPHRRRGYSFLPLQRQPSLSAYWELNVNQVNAGYTSKKLSSRAWLRSVGHHQLLHFSAISHESEVESGSRLHYLLEILYETRYCVG
jgi:hypothetical protein